MERNWHTLSVSEVEHELGTSLRVGLSRDEAKKRLETYGPNDLPEEELDGTFLLFLKQFQSPLIYVLFVASLIVFLMGDLADALIILCVLIFNAIIGAVQEGKAQGTLSALKKFAKSYATVLREKEEMIIPDSNVVPGEVIILQAGEKIPADARIVRSAALKIDESALTGESIPIHKEEVALKAMEIPQMERRNIVFKGTNVASGSGTAIVVATGGNTVIGKISHVVAAIDTEIPLKKDIRDLARFILWATAAISAAIFSVGVYFGRPVQEMFATVVALAVSIIPEGLPLILTLVLATGVWRMAKRNALVKKLQAVEALGQAKIIAVDKTGTITMNELIVREVFIGNKKFHIGGVGYEPQGEVRFRENVIDPANHPELLLAGKIAAFCANARAIFSEETKSWRVSGDPTEAAMGVFAEKVGFHKADLERESPLVHELPFDYKTKYHATAHLEGGNEFITVAGAPEAILKISEKIFIDGKPAALHDENKKEVMKVFHEMSARGLRVVAFGFFEKPQTKDHKTVEAELKETIFAGFYGMSDSLRPEVPEAMARAKEAGVKVVMITGDHKLTALAIAKEAGIYKEGDGILTEEELDYLSEENLAKELENVSVFARITPEHKMKIIKAYRKRGEIIAMTGDGVNDAPPLVAADLGVAMGKIGTEVAKEAADVILLDDNFGSIVSAIEEGRNMFKTIQKNILFLISTSLGEVFVIAGAVLAGLPLPVLPAQIIWLNLVTDPFMGLALAMEPKERGLLKKDFSRRGKGVIDNLMIRRFFFMAIPMTIGTFYLFRMDFEFDLAKAQTIALTALAAFQWINAWNCRSESDSVFGRGMFANKHLLWATTGAVILQAVAIYAPPFQKILHTVPITPSDWWLIGLVALSILVVEEIRKCFSVKEKQN